MPYLVVDDDFNRAWNKHNIGKVLDKAPSYTSVIKIPAIRFYFEWKPCGKLSNFLAIEIDGELHSMPNSSIVEKKFSIQRSWLTDEICDRIGEQLASDRSSGWTQFVDA